MPLDTEFFRIVLGGVDLRWWLSRRKAVSRRKLVCEGEPRFVDSERCRNLMHPELMSG